VGVLAWLVHNSQRCVFTYIKGLVGNRALRDLTHHEIYYAFKKAGIDLSNHAIMRLKDVRTKALGFETPNDIMKIFNKGTVEVTERAIEKSYGSLKAIISKETGKIISIVPN
jgi:filamentous hemagglutinin